MTDYDSWKTSFPEAKAPICDDCGIFEGSYDSRDKRRLICGSCAYDEQILPVRTECGRPNDNAVQGNPRPNHNAA